MKKLNLLAVAVVLGVFFAGCQKGCEQKPALGVKVHPPFVVDSGGGKTPQTGLLTRIGLAEMLAGSRLWKEKVPTAPCKQNFPDVSTDPQRCWVETLFKAGIWKGLPDGTFRPQYPINWAELVKIFSAAYSVPSVSQDKIDALGITQKDGQGLGNEHWYSGYIASFVKHGLLPRQLPFNPGDVVKKTEAEELFQKLENFKP